MLAVAGIESGIVNHTEHVPKMQISDRVKRTAGILLAGSMLSVAAPADTVDHTVEEGSSILMSEGIRPLDVVNTAAFGAIGYVGYKVYRWFQENGIEGIFGDIPDETLEVNVLRTEAYKLRLYIPMTVVSRLSVVAKENEAGWFDFLNVIPKVDIRTTPMGTQVVTVDAVGDVDIAISGDVEISRDEEDENQINVVMATPMTWRPRLVFDGAAPVLGGEMTGVFGVPSTRDRAANTALMAAQAVVGNEGCTAAATTLMQDGVFREIIEDILLGRNYVDSSTDTAVHEDMRELNYSSTEDTIVIRFVEPEDPPPESIAVFESYHLGEADPVETPVPILGANDAVELLQEKVEELDDFSVIDSGGNELTIEDLVERQKFCESGVLGPSVVGLTILPAGEVVVSSNRGLERGITDD